MDNLTTIEIYTGQRFGVILQQRDRDGELVTHEFRADRPDATYSGHYFAASDASEAHEDFARRVAVLRARG